MRASDKFLRGLLIGVRDRIQVQSRYSLIHLSAWKENSPKFAVEGACAEV